MPLDNPTRDMPAHPTLANFFSDVLTALGIQPSPTNIQAMTAWARAEGGDIHNNATWNPLNTTQTYAGSKSVNHVGVQAYSDYTSGVEATAHTLANGRYTNLLYSLRSAKDPSQIITAIGGSPWGTNAQLLQDVYSQAAHKGTLEDFSNMALRGGGGTVSTRPTTQVGPTPIGGAGTAFSPFYKGSGGIGGGHGGAGGAGGMGGGSGSASGGYSNMPAWDQKQFEAGLNSMGYASAFLKSDPELSGIFKQAIQGKWDGTKFENAIKASKWWEKRSQTQRSFDEQKYADPATFKRQQATTAAALVHQAAAMGFTLDSARANAIAVTVNRNGLSSDEVQNALASEIHYNAKQTYGGTIGSALTDIKKLGQDYNVALDDNTVGQWATKIAGGSATTQQYEEFIKSQAISKYPWLKDQINSGMTVADIASPFKGEMARILEIDPQSIQTDDPNIQRGLQYKDPTDTKGAYATMPLYDYQKMLRQDPRWLKTNNARDSVMDTATSVLHDFGLA